MFTDLWCDMKKIFVVFIILLVLFIGILVGSESGSSRAERIKENTEQFEKEIIIPGNDYQNKDNIIVPGKGNRVAKVGDRIIKDIFGFTFDFIKEISG